MMGFFETVFPPGWQLYVLIMVIFGLILFIVSLFLNKDENKEIKCNTGVLPRTRASEKAITLPGRQAVQNPPGRAGSLQ